ncbi:MAG: hypothetical protein IJB78_03520, partial [Oscillospiraceae bacterium]|nr:hypothetical protein [Oscillospiraceae bacterium]
LGCIFAKYSLLGKIKTHWGAKPQFCLAAIIVAAAVFYIHLYNHMTYNFIDAVVFICCLTVFLPSKPGQWAGKVFEILGEESTSMWLTHSFFCYYWCQKLVFAPKYSFLIFLWLLVLSFTSAKLIRFVYKYLGLLYNKMNKTMKKSV